MSLCYLPYAFNRDLLTKHILSIASARAISDTAFIFYSVKMNFVTVRNVYTYRPASTHISHSLSFWHFVDFTFLQELVRSYHTYTH